MPLYDLSDVIVLDQKQPEADQTLLLRGYESRIGPHNHQPTVLNSKLSDKCFIYSSMYGYNVVLTYK